MHGRQTLAQSVGAFFDTQIGPWQSVHLRWTDGTSGVGVSATRAQTTDIRLLLTYNIASSELDACMSLQCHRDDFRTTLDCRYS
jgi:hypothetical protein